MNPRKTENRHPVAVWMVFLVAMGLTTLFSGCAGNFGRFVVDEGVSKDFSTGVVTPGYAYYYAGRDTMPYAIIAIDRGYQVPSRFWVPFSPDAKQLAAMSANLYNDVRDQPYGARILDPDGAAIGVWFSTVFFRSVAVDPVGRTVEILFNNPENDDHMGLY